MYVDSQIELSDAQAVTATAISANVYDLFSMTTGGASAPVTPNARLDIGTDDLFLVVNSLAAATAAGAATVTITLESADDAALTTNAIVHYSTAAIPKASLTAGTNQVKIRVPRGLYRRYLGVRYTVATGPLTAGSFDAFLTPVVDNNVIYKSGFTVQ